MYMVVQHFTLNYLNEACIYVTATIKFIPDQYAIKFHIASINFENDGTITFQF